MGGNAKESSQFVSRDFGFRISNHFEELLIANHRDKLSLVPVLLATDLIARGTELLLLDGLGNDCGEGEGGGVLAPGGGAFEPTVAPAKIANGPGRFFRLFGNIGKSAVIV